MGGTKDRMFSDVPSKGAQEGVRVVKREGGLERAREDLERETGGLEGMPKMEGFLLSGSNNLQVQVIPLIF